MDADQIKENLHTLSIADLKAMKDYIDPTTGNSSLDVYWKEAVWAIEEELDQRMEQLFGPPY